MHISAIVAMSTNRVIGKDNQLLWHLPADLQHFKSVTMGKPILMGRKTFQSIGRALPGRCNVVITRDPDFQACGCVVANSIETALAAVEYSNEVFIIGGALLYEQMLPLTQRIYMTIVDHEFTGDAYFPMLDMQEWSEIDRVQHLPDEKNSYGFSFVTLERR
ncbi:MAG: dihydrofolate reductase [Gammaproteobacteria bacterium]